MSRITTKFIVDNAVTNAKIRQSAATSVIGNSSNSTANVADISASADGQVLQRSSSSLSFAKLVNSNIDSAAAIDFSKLASLTSGNILVGSAGNVATSVAMSGEATIVASGAVTLSNAAVIGKVLTGYSSTTGTISASDSILSAIEKLNGNIGLTITNPMTTLGDTIYGGSGGTPTRLAGNTTTTKKFWTQTGDGVNSAAPVWATIAAGDISGLTNSNLSGSAAITNANLAAMANNTVKANKSGGSAVPSDLALSDVTETGSSIFTLANNTKAVVSTSNLTIQANLTSAHIYVGNASNFPVDVAVSGDLISTNTGAFTIANSAVSNAKMANMANNTMKANISGGSAAPSDVSFVSTATASSGMQRDTNANTFINNLIEGYTTTATAAGTTTLTVSSTKIQYFTGTTTQTVLLPVTSTLALGFEYLIQNRSTGVVTVQSSGGNTIKAMESNSQLLVTVILTSGTNAASWDYSYSVVQGALPVADGGIGITSGTSGGILGFTASGTLASSAALTINQLIIGGGAGATPSTLAAGSQYQVLRMGATTPAYGSINLDQTAAVTGVLPSGNVGLGRTINAQTGTTYTFVLADGSAAGGNPLVTASNSSAQTYTVPPNSSVAFPTGTQIDLTQLGTGKVTLAQGTGVTINSKSSNKSISAQYVGVSLVKYATDTWLLLGDLIA